MINERGVQVSRPPNCYSKGSKDHRKFYSTAGFYGSVDKNDLAKCRAPIFPSGIFQCKCVTKIYGTSNKL